MWCSATKTQQVQGDWRIYGTITNKDRIILLADFDGFCQTLNTMSVSRNGRYPEMDISLFFPTCQVRVVRFYQSCCPPPPPPPVSPRPYLHQLPPPLPPCQLFAKLFANFRAQCALLDLNLGPSQLSSVRTAGPQPGTFPAQCAPLDLNLGPSQLSAHRWTSTWDLPSSVRTAGPQRPDRMPKDMPHRMPDGMPEDMPEHLPEDMPGRMPEAMPDRMPDRMPEDMSDRMPEDMPDRMPEGMPDRMSDRIPEGMSDRMPEDLPVTKCINVMVGITRSKICFQETCKTWQTLSLRWWSCIVFIFKSSRGLKPWTLRLGEVNQGTRLIDVQPVVNILTWTSSPLNKSGAMAMGSKGSPQQRLRVLSSDIGQHMPGSHWVQSGGEMLIDVGWLKNEKRWWKAARIDQWSSENLTSWKNTKDCQKLQI